MGLVVGSGGSTSNGIKEVCVGKVAQLVVEDIKIKHREYEVDVPVYKDKEQIRYVTKDEDQTKFNTVEKETIIYVPKEVETVKYQPRVEETVRYKVKEIEVEKPVMVEKPYEKPVMVSREVEIITYKDVDAIKELIGLVKDLREEVKETKKNLDEIKKYVLVEEIIRVPKINYKPTEVERIVWKDVSRERCQSCGGEV